MGKRLLVLTLTAVLALSCTAVVHAEDDEDDTPSMVEKYEDQILALDYNTVYQTRDEDYTESNILEDEELDAEAAITHLTVQWNRAKNHMIAIFNLTSDLADEDDPTLIKLAVSTVKASKQYAVYSFNIDTGEWDSTSSVVTAVADGLLTVRVTGSYTVAVVEL